MNSASVKCGTRTKDLTFLSLKFQEERSKGAGFKKLLEEIMAENLQIWQKT